MDFNSQYTDYWKNRVNNANDGTRPADEEVVVNYLPYLETIKGHVLLDVGCSYGRFYDLLNVTGPVLWGIDPDKEAVKQCIEKGYAMAVKGFAENLPFDPYSVDRIFCWATFDCTKQNKALLEFNRVLKPNGLLMFTGKNTHYHSDDDIAFIAERNARLKNFPNHFTHTNDLWKHCHRFGYAPVVLFCFERRGDFGSNKFIKIEAGQEPPHHFYEYLMVLKKTGSPLGDQPIIADEFSHVSKAMAAMEQYTNIDEYFKYHQQQFSE